MKNWIFSLLLITASAFAADNIIGLDGNNLLIDNASRKWDTKVIYTTDGSGNVIPIGSSSITIGTVTQGGQSPSAAPWQFDLEQILGATPSATNYVPSRITNGTSYVDPTQIRALSSGTDSVTIQGGNSTAVKVDGSAVTQPVSISGTVPVSGTVTSNIGTTNGLALDATLSTLSTGILLNQASTTASQKGPLVQGAVTTSAPSYTTGNSNPLSLTTAGGLRVDGSATTQPVSGTVTANAGSGTFTVGQATAANLNATVVQSSGSNLHVNVDSAPTITVTGTVTANAGTNLNTSLLSTSANQTNGSQKSQVVDGSGNVYGPTTTISATNYMPVIQASSATPGSAVPSRATLIAGSDGTNAQSLSLDPTGKVNINNISGTVSLPTGASTSANQTNGNQKSQRVDGSGNVAPAGDVVGRSIFVKPGDGTTSITVKAASTAAIATDTSQVVALSPNTALPAGTNFLGSVSLGNTTGKSVVMTPGNLTSTSTTADQVVVTYTVTTGKTFYLQNWDIYVQRSTFNTTVADFGNCSLESPAGAKLWTQELSGSGFASWDKHVGGEPIPIGSATVVRIVCTPGANTSTLWRGDLIGYEK